MPLFLPRKMAHEFLLVYPAIYHMRRKTGFQFMLNDSNVQATVSLDLDGKQFGHLIAPNSTQFSAYGTEMIPIIVLRNGEGPGILLTGGVHGDEFEGPVALVKLARDLDPKSINGLVVIIPSLNLPATLASSRLSPIDGRNLNRVFPGNRQGSFSEVLADFVVRGLLPHVDYVADIHSGGTSLEYVPLTMMHQIGTAERIEKSLGCMKAFGAPYGLLTTEQEGGGMLEWHAEIQGKVVISTELGGAGRITRQSVEITETGVRNMLVFAGILNGKITPPEVKGRAATRIISTPDLNCFVLCPGDGLLEGFVGLEKTVEVGQPLGQLHDIRRPEEPALVVPSPRSGLVIGLRPLPMTRMGDCMFLIADEWHD
jgi:N2-acetyl-L-2,4-diaminobutanoate deacetylase